jgi:hypothetical protein
MSSASNSLTSKGAVLIAEGGSRLSETRLLAELVLESVGISGSRSEKRGTTEEEITGVGHMMGGSPSDGEPDAIGGAPVVRRMVEGTPSVEEMMSGIVTECGGGVWTVRTPSVGRLVAGGSPSVGGRREGAGIGGGLVDGGQKD